MSENLSLEERTTGHLLVNPSLELLRPWMVETIDCNFLDKPEDAEFLPAVQDLYFEKRRFGIDGQAQDSSQIDQKILDVVRRNPFLLANFYEIAKAILIRTITSADYKIRDGLISIISDPYGKGYRKYFREQDGPNVPTRFLLDDNPHTSSALVFFYNLGVSLGKGMRVRKEILAFVEAYRKRWQVHLFEMERLMQKGRYPGVKPEEVKAIRNNLHDYGKLINPGFAAPPDTPLLEGDWQIINVFAHLKPDRLRKYVNRYAQPSD